MNTKNSILWYLIPWLMTTWYFHDSGVHKEEDNRKMRILGISAYYHDSAAALVKEGTIIAAAQEERFTRKKHDARFPKNAILYTLAEAKISLNKLDYIVFYGYN